MSVFLKRWPLLVMAVLSAFLLVMSACGGDDDEEGGEATPSGGVTAEATEAGGDGGEGDTTGVTDTSIKIGTLLPMSNTSAAAWGVPLAAGMKAYYDYINDQGGIYGRKIEFIVGDSQYTGPVASETIRKLVEQDEIFALQGSLGTAAHSAVYKYLEERGIPDMFILTGNTMWTVPLAHSRFGFLVDYITEGRILGKYIAETYPDGKVGIIAQNDDFGKEGEKGLRQGLEENGHTGDVVVEYYDETQNDMTAQTQRLQNENVDVIGFYGMPVQTGSIFKVTRETLNWDVPIVITGVDAVEVVALLAGGGESGFDNIEGAISVVFGYQAFETDQPGVARYREIMAQYAPDAEISNLTITGYTISEAMVNNLKQAGPNLTRESFLDAAESVCEFLCSTCMVPTSVQPDDHRPTEVEVYVKATIDRTTSPATFTWAPFGEPFGFETTTDCEQPTRPEGYDDQPTTMGD